tara:strand:- start:209 stop:505 length:297 start_codon:yes stop_codon:yes gene_type:complete
MTKYCLHCGSTLGIDCGDAEPDFNDNFCSKICYQKRSNKITDEQLMMFADGELNNRELSMNIISALIDGDKELQARLDVFVKTRSALLNSLLTKEEDI